MISHRTAAVSSAAVLAFALVAGAASPLRAQSVEEFYKGKTVDLVIGYSPGGTYDLYARLVGRYLGAHIPGKPTVVVRNMPGAGSRTAVTWMFSVARKDGTVLGTADQSLALQQAMGDKGLKFDVSKLNYIGNPNAENNTTVTWYTTGVKTVEDATKKEITMGATGGSTSSQFPKAMNFFLGTKFKIILGYPGGNDINLALERGEVGGRGSNSWAAWKSTRPQWLAEKKINILVQIGLKKAPDLQDVPLLSDLGKTDDDKRALKLLAAPTAIGRPIFTTPDVPADRVAALRKAFDDMMKDPAFLEDAKNSKFEIEYVPGAEMQSIVEDIISTPKPIVARLHEAIGDAF
jgi:tripartite-type tricarboxylate transporter receptor subunit TctC